MNKFSIAITAILLGTACLSTEAAASAAETSEPIANPVAIVTSGHARFTVLTPQMIRIQYSARGLFEDRATFAVVNRRLPVPEFTTTEEGNYLYIKTSALTLRYRKNAPLSATSHSSEALKITFHMNGQEIIWYPGKDDALNLKGTSRTLDGAIGDNKRGELENGLISRAGWAVIDESPLTKRGDGSTTFAFDKPVNGVPWVAEPVDKSAVDWYFMGYGHDYKQALADYTKIGGREPMPPRYVFGYWYSRYWAYTQQDFVNLVNAMQSREIPLDVMILDMDWHTEGWTGWTWNKQLIPNPPALLKWMHGRNLKTSLNLHPADGVDSDEDGFDKLRNDMGLPASTTNVPWQLEDSTFYKCMFKDIIHPLADNGVDFWWLDWQQNLLNKRLSGLSETFWCNHVFFNDMRINKPELRPMIFHRWGGLGSHRYPIGFSGDSFIDYSTLDYEIYFTSTASNVCFGYWGHDLGGHQKTGNSGDPNDPELYLRWMQFGVFTPIFRTHATKDASIERRIWEFDNFTDLRNVVQLRYRMIPYIYTAARQAYDTGISICRPMYYDNPEDNEAYRNESQYMFGDNLLVAPIASAADNEGLAYRKVWLPSGQWFNISKNRIEEGGKELYEGYTLKEIPLFMKEGSIVPTYNDSVRNLERLPADITLYVAPGNKGGGSLYEDNGNNDDYKNGAYAITTFSQNRDGQKIQLTISKAEGTFDGMPLKHNYIVKILGETAEPQDIILEGNKLQRGTDWKYDSSTNVVTINIPSLSKDKQATLVINRTVTGIKDIALNASENAPMWNLAGQRADSDYKGIIIQNGKKRIQR